MRIISTNWSFYIKHHLSRNKDKGKRKFILLRYIREKEQTL